MLEWFRNIWTAVSTVAQGMWVTLRVWLRTYRPEKKTFTEHFEYPGIAGTGCGPLPGFSSF